MSKEEFLSVYERQQASGLTIKDFCENEPIHSPVSTIGRRNSAWAVLTPAIRTSFPMIRSFHWICITGAISRQSGGDVTIELPSGIRIHLDSHGNPELTFGLIHKLCGHVLSE